MKRKLTINFLLSYKRIIMPNLIWKGKKHELNLIDLSNKESFQKVKKNIGNLLEKYKTHFGKEINKKTWHNLLIYGENEYIMNLLLNDLLIKLILFILTLPLPLEEIFHIKYRLDQKIILRLQKHIQILGVKV